MQVDDREDDIRVWENETGAIVGVANHEALRGEVFLQSHPDHRGLEDEMIEWAEENLAVETDDGKRRLSVSVYDYDTLRQTILENRGYRQSEQGAHTYRRSLASAFPEPTVPEGYTVRSLREDDDLSRRRLAMGRAFGSEPVDTDTYRSLQSAPGYRLELDIVARRCARPIVDDQQFGISRAGSRYRELAGVHTRLGRRLVGDDNAN